MNEIQSSDFDLPSLQDELEQATRELEQGSGLAVFHGLTPGKYTRRENFIIFAGISSHLSQARGFQSGSKILCHITDLTKGGELSLPSPYSNTALSFHTDFGDIVAMYVLSTASQGGFGTFASVSAIYKLLRSLDPDILSTLSKEDWPFDRPINGEICDFRPLLYFSQGRPEMIFSRGSLINSPRSTRSKDMPNLTERQSVALDAVHFLAEQVQFQGQWKKGDLVFFNNKTLLHGRDSFTNSGKGQPRHLLRMWLKAESEGRTLPIALQRRWDRIFRNVDAEDDEEMQWPQEPDAR